MNISPVTSKGQVVIPAPMRKIFGIGKGTRVGFFRRGDELILKPLTRAHFDRLAGFLKTRGKLSRKLLASRRQERMREDRL